MDLVNQLITPVFSAALAFLAAWFWATRKAKNESDEKLREQIASLQRQLDKLDANAQTINTVFQAALVKQLTHYHTPRLDELMVKLGPPVTLTNREMKEMIVLLEERTRDQGNLITQEEREAAEILPYVIKRVAREAEIDLSDAPKAVVAVPEVVKVEDDRGGG